ncbi:Cyclic AMP-responsive element-binding protein 3-like protein 1 [Varanus komodoensis]|nr:Cyclic AMP-responsive element-binding protein 3-like protein 1 [Varanus komodoensis]
MKTKEIQVLVLCFVLVLGSMMPCLPEFSATSQTVKTAPKPDIYTTSKSLDASCPALHTVERSEQVNCKVSLTWQDKTPNQVSNKHMLSQFIFQSRSLLFYDEPGGSLEEGYSSFISVEAPEKWEAEKRPSEEEEQPLEHVRSPLAVAHETEKYLNKPRPEGPNQNQTSSALSHPKERFHERDRTSSDTAEYL